MAHEIAHIRQFKENVEGVWQTEPHADFLVGWALAQYFRENLSSNVTFMAALIQETKRYGIEQAVETMFRLGDVEFNSPEHHGQPHYRAVMVRAGYESGELPLTEAFDKGLTWAKLNREATSSKR